MGEKTAPRPGSRNRCQQCHLDGGRKKVFLSHRESEIPKSELIKAVTMVCRGPAVFQTLLWSTGIDHDKVLRKFFTYGHASLNKPGPI